MGSKQQLNILVVDDDQFMRDVVATMISDNGHLPLVADGYQQALAALSKNKIDLILMDIEMPEVNGFALTSMIREIYNHWIPIIFLSSNDSEEYLSKGIDAGGDDYLTKPVKEVILKAKIRAMARIASMQDELELLNRKLSILSNIDPLTGVMNKRALHNCLNEQWSINRRQKSELSILMVDIDFFKLYNDNYGHQKGDRCLVRFTKVLVSLLNRETDYIARYGGEEFLILLPFTPLEGARFKAKEIMNALEKFAIKHGHSSIAPYVTASIGISSTKLNAKNTDELVNQADIALYKAKESGRKQSYIFKSA
ncbi:MAG: diguanylate cyclase response regulator [Gammaproteobacteria bacterium]|nr:MAG: diguanylate cyclase response regulator [Gammaproteobacteria bacterium]